MLKREFSSWHLRFRNLKGKHERNKTQNPNKNPLVSGALGMKYSLCIVLQPGLKVLVGHAENAPGHSLEKLNQHYFNLCPLLPGSQ